MASETRARMQLLLARAKSVGAGAGHYSPLMAEDDTTEGETDAETPAAPLPNAHELQSALRSRSTLQKVLAHSTAYDDSGNASDASRLSPQDGSVQKTLAAGGVMLTAAPAASYTEGVSATGAHAHSRTPHESDLMGLHRLTEAAASLRGRTLSGVGVMDIGAREKLVCELTLPFV